MVASPMNKDVFALPAGSGASLGTDPLRGCSRVPAVLAGHAAIRRLLAGSVAGLAFALAACSSPMDKHPDIKLNPHPVQRYELTATVDAPGAFDSVIGYVSYSVTNVECVPRDAWEGARNVPTTSRSFELTRVDGHTWKGYFYRDQLRSEDYFGLGVCRWDVGTVSPVFIVHGQSFSPGLMLPELLGGQPNTRYFKLQAFFDRSMSDDNAGSALSWSSRDKDVEAQPARFFPITARVVEVKP